MWLRSVAPKGPGGDSSPCRGHQELWLLGCTSKAYVPGLQVASRVDTQLAKDGLGVRANGMPGDAEAHRDFLVRELLAHEAQDNALLLGQQDLPRARAANEFVQRPTDIRVELPKSAK